MRLQTLPTPPASGAGPTHDEVFAPSGSSTAPVVTGVTVQAQNTLGVQRAMVVPEKTSVLQRGIDRRASIPKDKISPEKDLERASAQQPSEVAMAPDGAPSLPDSSTMLVGNNTLYAGLAPGAVVVGNITDVAGAPVHSSVVFNRDVVGFGASREVDIGHVATRLGGFGHLAAGLQLHIGKLEDGTAEVEQTAHRRFGGVGTDSTFFNIGFGGGLGVNGAKEITFRRTLPIEEAAAALKIYGSGPLARARNKAMALGMLKPPLDWPNLAEPHALREGDRVRCIVTGILQGWKGSVQVRVSLTTPVAVGKFALNWAQEHEITVERGAKNLVTVEVAPKSKLTGGLGVELPLIAGAQGNLTHDASMKYAYQFDLDDPAALDAYQRLLHGELPEPKEVLEAITHDTASARAQTFRDQVLPGVTRLFVERTKVPLRTSYGTALYLTRQIPGGGKLAWGKETYRAERVRATSEGSDVQKWRSSTVNRGLGAKGSASETQFSTSHQRFGTDDEKLTSHVHVGVTYGTDAVHGTNPTQLALWLNREVLSEHRLLAGTDRGRVSNHAYEVTLSRQIDASEWAMALASLEEKPASLHPALRALLTEVKAKSTSQSKHDDILNALQSYLTSRGKEGFGQLHRLLGNDSALTVNIKVPGVTSLKDEANLLRTRYVEKISPNMPADELDARVFDVSQTTVHIAELLDAVQHDPVTAALDAGSAAEAISSLKRQMDDLFGLVDLEQLHPVGRNLVRNALSPDAQSALAVLEQRYGDAKQVAALLQRLNQRPE